MIQKNDIIDLEITGVTSEGNGVGRFNNMAIFVPSAANKDKLKVKILKVKKNYAFAKIEEIIVPSKDRINLDCDVSLKCGGCSFRHITYDSELEIKQNKVIDSMTRIGKLENINILPIVGANDPNYYRNKAQLPVGVSLSNNICIGFFAPHSHRIVECTNCMLHDKRFNPIINIFKSWMIEHNITSYSEETHSGIVRHLYLRIGKKTGEIMVCIVINANNLPFKESLINNLKDNTPNLKGIILNINKKHTNVILSENYKTIYGQSYITDELCDLKFNISPASFYQVNRDQAEKLYNIAKKYANLNKNDILLDLYCGTGTIGLTMAKDVKKLIGVEIIESAVKDAYENAKLNNINNAEFICSDASNAATLIKSRKEHPTVIVLDPPRKGCDKSLIDTIVNMNPERIVYISCDPATLARDLNLFYNMNYDIKELTPVDLFPRTNHVETVALMLQK